MEYKDMNGKLISGIVFQLIQFLVLGTLLLMYALDDANISRQTFTIVLGVIMWAGLNILSLVLIWIGLSQKK